MRRSSAALPLLSPLLSPRCSSCSCSSRCSDAPTSLVLKVVIVPLARGMVLELAAETLLTTGMHGAAPRSRTHPSPLLRPASLCALHRSCWRPMPPRWRGTLLEMAAETVGGTLGMRCQRQLPFCLADSSVLPTRLRSP